MRTLLVVLGMGMFLGACGETSLEPESPILEPESPILEVVVESLPKGEFVARYVSVVASKQLIFWPNQGWTVSSLYTNDPMDTGIWEASEGELCYSKHDTITHFPPEIGRVLTIQEKHCGNVPAPHEPLVDVNRVFAESVTEWKWTHGTLEQSH